MILDAEIRSYLFNCEIGLPLARQQLKQLYHRIISENIRNQRCVEVTAQLATRVMSYDLKNHHLAILRRDGAYEDPSPCSVDLWDLNSFKRLWFYPIEITVPNKGKIQITDDLDVVVPLGEPTDSILVVADGATKTFFTTPQIWINSARVIGNEIAAYTKEKFSVWNTKGDLQWDRSFPNDQTASPLVASNRNYFITQLGNYAHWGIIETAFKGSSSFFVADLEKRKTVINNDLDLGINAKTQVSALSLGNDILYVATCVTSVKKKFALEYSDAKIIQVNLLNMRIIRIFQSEFVSASIESMHISSSHIVFIGHNTRKRNEERGNRQQVGLLCSLPEEDEKAVVFEVDRYSSLDYGKCTFCNTGDYISLEGQLKEIASIAAGKVLNSIDIFNHFEDGIFLSLPHELWLYNSRPSQFTIRNYNVSFDNESNREKSL